MGGGSGGGSTQQGGGGGSGLDVLQQLTQSDNQLALENQQYYQSLMGQQSAIGIGSGSGAPTTPSLYSGSAPPSYGMSSLGGFDPTQFQFGTFG